ncbi:hypothetical protein D9619_004736 [Psilocybe cf. subviscida]|uniref:Uncharacterized protein n=1 Tax=Psilocybe cf. subviscida TaxID=2480587 RepID=A0A8H5BP71_9AGAR|nr:hypothetical protein D9619_004736 [Psilocybe cf. subviscida]
MILTTLSTSIITTLLLSVIAIFGYGPFKKDISYTILIYMLAHITAAVTLISCNLLVVLCTIYRAVIRWASAPPKSTTYTETETAISIVLTEVSLSQASQVQLTSLYSPNDTIPNSPPTRFESS